ncbi:hypothetical protein PROFUN_15716 [Planoprotostelium fungivorum]|uniref:LicD/FKTN/FKRP nucleotidyltransferase domain-containing protein n=1 Tax=Planoprotostelium fungivorum TaxID=1890364 RepID=A0A2P6MUZ3_9EUKA|nr:hypothetical protein PROFUN_15716 [Planoprotostelium fungivorum]
MEFYNDTSLLDPYFRRRNDPIAKNNTHFAQHITMRWGNIIVYIALIQFLITFAVYNHLSKEWESGRENLNLKDSPKEEKPILKNTIQEKPKPDQEATRRVGVTLPSTGNKTPKEQPKSKATPKVHPMSLIDNTPYLSQAVVWEEEPDRESMTDNHRLLLYSRGDYVYNPLTIKTTIIDLLKTLRSFMEKNGFEYWLTHGTLLGAHRDHEFIPWDTDADIGITAQTAASLLKLFKDNNGTSQNVIWGTPHAQMIVRKGKHIHIIPFKFCDTQTGRYVDLIVFHDKPDNEDQMYMKWPEWRSCVSCPRPKKNVDKSTVFPLSSIQFSGEHFPSPVDTEKYLKGWYRSLAAPKAMPVEYRRWTINNKKS